jgi:Ca-activated chloride channel family protein
VRIASPAWLLLLLAIPPLVVLTLRTARAGSAKLSPLRLRGFLALRAASMALLALGLAGLEFTRMADRLAVVFLLDESWSVSPDQRARSLQTIEAVRSRMRTSDPALLVRFGATAAVTTLSPGAPFDDGTDGGGEDVDGSATDIASALQFALAQAAPLGTPRLVLLTDGNANRGSAAEAAVVAKSLGARIYPMALAPLAAAGATASRGEVAVEDLRAAARVRAGEPHEVVVIVRSRAEARARVTLFRDTEPVATREVYLSPGENVVQFSALFPDRGLHAWDAVVESPTDVIAQNNHGRRLVEVTGPPQVLYAARQGRSSGSFLAALAAQGISVVQTEPSRLPGTLAGLLPYDALILDDAPGYAISNEKMETVARWVRDAGGGLLMIGGESSFGAGGYYKTAIERALPVDMDVKSLMQLPRLTLAIVVDRSGSMGGTVASGGTKLDVVKSAALSAIEALNPFDRVGILGFDAEWQWAVPLTDAGDTRKIAGDLAALAPGGGTIMEPALAEAYRVISASPSPLRHLIVLSDGLTNPGGFEVLVRKMAAQKITVSTVAVGEDADRKLLSDIASWGGGRAYATNDPRDVPQIFMAETILVSRGLLVEKSFLPRVASMGESIKGIDLSTLPALGGFVLTYLKPGAEEVLSALYDAPLLATWRYGLGRSAAFTSDFRARWARSWLAWDQFPRFVAQLVRWIERPTGAEILHPRVGIDKGRASLVVDAYDQLGAYANGLVISGVLAGPDGKRTEISVPQTGPGLYAAGFEAARVGDHILTLTASSGAQPLPPLTLGISVPYAEEYRVMGADAGLLGRLAAETGGRLIASADDGDALQEVLRREPGLAPRATDAWRYLLLAALAAFFLDILARRLVLPERQRARSAPRSSIEELAGMVSRSREEEKKKLRERVSGFAREGKIDPDLAAYLYIARLSSKRREEKE